MASILVLGENGIGTALANRLASEGHIVKMWTRGQSKAFAAGRNPSRVNDPTKMLDQYDLVVSSNCGLGELCDSLASKGKAVVGGSVFSDKLAMDVSYRDRVVKSLVKLEQAQDTLQLGVLLTTTVWFDGSDFVRPFSHSISKTRFMDGNRGCNSCQMGCVVWSTTGDKLTATLLEPLAPLLLRVGYVGPVGVTYAVSEQSIKWYHWDAQFGYDTLQAWMELIKLSLFDYLYKMSCKQLREAEHHTEQAMAVRLSVPPYPYDYEKRDSVDGLLTVPDEAKRHVWQAGNQTGVLGCVTARGQTVRECERRAYRTIKNIVQSADVQYRSDIGAGVDEARKQLVEWQWLV